MTTEEPGTKKPRQLYERYIPPNELMKMHRVRNGYSQEKLADLINEFCGETSLYQMRVSRYEAGKEVPEQRHKVAINSILKEEIWS